MPNKGFTHVKQGTRRGHLADTENARVSPSFVTELRRVLHHLYDWVKLSKSPLIELFGVEHSEDSPAALRAALREAIESLKPAASVSPKAKAWRTYQVLHSRYVEQFTQREVASELGLSIRHLRREESLAVQTLAAYLWDHYTLKLKWQGEKDAPPRSERPEKQVLAAGATTPTQEQELVWLHDSLPSEPAEVEETIRAALQLTTQLTQASQVQMELRMPGNLPRWIVKTTPLQQALLILFTVAIGRVPGGQISISAHVDGAEICVSMQANGPSPAPAEDADTSKRLEMAKQLVELSDGYLEISEDKESEGAYTIEVVLPAEEQISVLVIDDNVDTLQLLQRYLSNSRYRFTGISDPQQALQIATDATPRVIVLDVMLPEVDGWELLGRLSGHPQTCDIPIVVCTILPQEQLAFNLGAEAFISKPVSRSGFLSVLDHLLEQSSKGSR
jgi:CheY-like chemotaxis protein